MKKKINIISAILFFSGLVLVFGTLIAISFNLDKILNITEESVVIEEEFSSISVDFGTTDIILKPSTDGKCTLVTKCSNGIEVEYGINNGVLEIKERKDTFKTLFNFNSSTATLYLPKNSYEKFKLDGSSTDVEISKIDFAAVDIFASTGDVKIQSKINNLKIELSTGDVDITDLTANELGISVTTGEIKITGTKVLEDVTVKASTGDVSIENTDIGKCLTVNTSSGDFDMNSVTAGVLKGKTSTGEVTLENVKINGEMMLETSSGDIDMVRCDANSLNIKASSGDVKATLLSSKIFYVISSSGDISVPKSTEGGMCQVETSSGDILFAIVN